VFLGFPTAAAFTVKAARPDFLELGLCAFGVELLINLFEWLVADWLVFCRLTPRFVVLPVAEGTARYQDYGMHFRGVLICTAISPLRGTIVAVVVSVV
jgi:hypothetical protein